MPCSTRVYSGDAFKFRVLERFFCAMDAQENALAFKQMLSAAVAGTLADGIMYPMQTVKSRLMVQGANGSGSVLYMYKGPLHALFSIATQEGWRTLYKGYATLVQVSFSQAIYMGIYQTTKRIVPGFWEPRSGGTRCGEDSPVVHFGGGLAATLVQSLINVPVDIIRQRQMVQTATEGAYKSSLDAARTMYRQEGICSLYRGFFFAQMVWGPYNAIYLPLWERSKRLCARRCELDDLTSLEMKYELASSFFSASIAAALTNPMDVIKTRLQVQGKSNVSSGTNYSGAMDAAAAIWKNEGFRGFTSGITSRIFWVAPGGMIMFTAYDQILKRVNRL